MEVEEKITSAIKKAQGLLNKINFDSEEQKNIAFSKAMEYFLMKNKEVVNASSNAELMDGESRVQNIKIESDDDFWNLLRRESGLESNVLKDIYTLNKQQISVIISDLKGKNNAEQSAYLSLLICFAYHYGKNMEWVQAQFLVEAAKYLNFHVTNLNRDINKNGWFRKRGKKKGVEYKLSGVGLLEVKKYLDELKTYGSVI